MISKNDANKSNLVAHYIEHNEEDQIWDDEVKFYQNADGTYEKHLINGYKGETNVSTVSFEELEQELNKVKASQRGVYRIVKDFLEPKPITVGSVAYFYEDWVHTVEKCVVESTKEENGVLVAKVKCVCTVDLEGEVVSQTQGYTTKKMSELYPSVSTAYDAYFHYIDEKTRKYEEEIKNVRDLAMFPLKHFVRGEECTDYEAVVAYKQRVSELLGIDLESESYKACDEALEEHSECNEEEFEEPSECNEEDINEQPGLDL